MSTPLAYQPPVELDSRTGGGLEVLLLWAPTTGRLWVVVLDLPTGEFFMVDARPDNALDVFHHPFAYGSFRESELLAA